MQVSFSELEYAAKKKVTRPDRFLCEIDAITPWSALVVEIEPYYPRAPAVADHRLEKWMGKFEQGDNWKDLLT